MYSLTTPLSAVTGIGPTLLNYCQKRDLTTVADLLLTLPLRYEDLSLTQQIQDLTDYDGLPLKVSLTARVESLSRMRGKGGLRARLRDDTGTVTAMWFNSRFVFNTLQIGSSYVFSGIYNPRYKSLTQPVFEPLERSVKLHTGRLVPIYTSTLGIKQGTLRRILHQILTNLGPSPIKFRLKPDLNDWRQVLNLLHFPETADSTLAARQQLAFEELLNLSLQARQIQNDWRVTRSNVQIKSGHQTYWTQLPFQLTDSQKNVLDQIYQDLGQPYPMNRLLLGDVGSGKTIVAILAGLAVIKKQRSVCLIAPTRVLAQQHMVTLHSFFPQVPTQLITSATKFDSSNLTKFKNSFVVATHAVLPHLVKLNPGLIIFDEQQRFGVKQRSPWPLTDKNQTMPHVLTMSATPIPRSLMLTVFAHLQLSVLDQMPSGRLETKTWFVPATKRSDAWSWMQKHLDQNPSSLCLVVCPFIDPSQAENMANVQAVTKEYQRLTQVLPRSIHVGLLHAKLNKKQQQVVIDQLNQQKIQVLVATPMIEVGIDLPTADIMVIEGADRFGLSSLHQLRGRVGRRGQQGYCLVFSSLDQGNTRLTQFCQLKSGQDVAELDLKTRGAGDLFGVEQSGFTALRFASWSNLALIQKVQHTLSQIPADWSSVLFSDRPLDKKANPN